MNNKKDKLLQEANNSTIDFILRVFPFARMEEFIISDVTGYGTTIDERIFDIEGFKPQVITYTKNLVDKVEFRIKHNGQGIPVDIKAKIFQPFFTNKPTGEGTGLGLSFSYDIIKTQGGELKVETLEGEGSEFIFTISINDSKK